MTAEILVNELDGKMQKTIGSLEHDLSGIRTGRASPALIEPIIAEVYGSKMPISQLATVSSIDARSLSIQIWDKEATKAVEKAITNANLGVNPATEGQMIRITLPSLTEERRVEYAKLAAKYGEASKVAIRNLRRDVIDHLKKFEKNKEISEDDLKKMTDKVQKTTDDNIKKIDEKIIAKEKEITQV